MGHHSCNLQQPLSSSHLWPSQKETVPNEEKWCIAAKNYHLVMTNIAMERSSMLLSSVNHLFRLGPSIPWLYVSHNQMVYSPLCNFLYLPGPHFETTPRSHRPQKSRKTAQIWSSVKIHFPIYQKYSKVSIKLPSTSCFTRISHVFFPGSIPIFHVLSKCSLHRVGFPSDICDMPSSKLT